MTFARAPNFEQLTNIKIIFIIIQVVSYLLRYLQSSLPKDLEVTLFNPNPHCLGIEKAFFCKNENKSWMAYEKNLFESKMPRKKETF
jgi:hypothetical protein